MQVADMVEQITESEGTSGVYTLGAAVPGKRLFSTAFSDGDTPTYCVSIDGGDFEIGIGTLSATGTILTRTAVFSSSNANAPVDWPGGKKVVKNVLHAANQESVRTRLDSISALVSETAFSDTQINSLLSATFPAHPLSNGWQDGFIDSSGLDLGNSFGYFQGTKGIGAIERFTQSGAVYDSAMGDKDLTALYSSAYGLGATAISLDGLHLYYSGAGTRRVIQFTFGTAWDVSTLTYTHAINNDLGEVSQLVLNPNGMEIYACIDGNIKTVKFGSQWNLSGWSLGPTYTFPGSNGITSGFLNSAGDALYCVHGDEPGKILKYTLTTPGDITTIDGANPTTALTDSAAGKGIYWPTISANGKYLYYCARNLHDSFVQIQRKQCLLAEPFMIEAGITESTLDTVWHDDNSYVIPNTDGSRLIEIIPHNPQLLKPYIVPSACNFEVCSKALSGQAASSLVIDFVYSADTLPSSLALSLSVNGGAFEPISLTTLWEAAPLRACTGKKVASFLATDTLVCKFTSTDPGLVLGFSLRFLN